MMGLRFSGWWGLRCRVFVCVCLCVCVCLFLPALFRLHLRPKPQRLREPTAESKVSGLRLRFLGFGGPGRKAPKPVPVYSTIRTSCKEPEGGFRV